MNQKKSEDAVSPVIGVMLLLVVTIVIAAVVAVFASGVGMDAEPAPATAVDVDEISDGYYITKHTMNSDPGNGLVEAKNQWIDESGNTLSSHNGAKYQEYYIEEGGNKVAFARRDVLSSSILPTMGDPYMVNGKSDLFEIYTTKSNIDVFERTITLSCLHGESIDLSKISIQIDLTNANGNFHFEFPRNTYSGSLSVGDKTKLKLESSDTNIDFLTKGQEVDVTVFYGDYVLVSDKLMVTRG